jgi:hypothetical protein
MIALFCFLERRNSNPVFHFGICVVAFFMTEFGWTLYFFLIHPEYPWFLGYTRPINSLSPEVAQIVLAGKTEAI